MFRKFSGIALLFTAGLAFAEANTPEVAVDQLKHLEQEIERATETLEKAAQRLAELHAGQHTRNHKGGKKAMLGILLGPKPGIGGVAIVGTTPQGGAAQAGLAAGDLVVEIADIDLRNSDDPLGELSGYMKGVTAGDAVRVVIARGGDELTREIITQPKSQHIIALMDSSQEDLSAIVKQSLEDMDIDVPIDFAGEFTHEINTGPAQSRQIMYVEGDLADYFDVQSGVVVVDVEEDSDLKAGDVLVALGDVDVHDVDAVGDYLAAVESATAAQVKRKGRNTDVVIQPGEFVSESQHHVKVIRKHIEKSP